MTWNQLNVWLRTCTELQLRRALRTEMQGRRRVLFLFRMHGRLNRIRGRREASTLNKLAQVPKGQPVPLALRRELATDKRLRRMP